MFENILHQEGVISRLKSDLEGGNIAPSILFSGPTYSGKGTAALELARITSCENEAKRGNWNCSCPSCVRQRNLVSPDLLLLGRRRFFEEIAASSGAYLRSPASEGSKMLFLRAVRKLLARFNSILWEDDPRLGKLKTQIGVLEEDLEDVEAGGDITEPGKKCESILKKAAKLESDGLGELIPIAQIRRAAYWSRLAPLGRHKCIIMENAENMQEGAKNALLKILEEPPPHLLIVLTSSRPRVLLPTMLSRLREYRFLARGPDEEKEVISRIFREPGTEAVSIDSYLSSFLPAGSGTLYLLGAFFASSVAAEAYRECRARGREASAVLIDLGKFSAAIAEKGNMGPPAGTAKEALQKILAEAGNFLAPGLFTRFVQQCSALVSAWLRSGGPALPGGHKSPATIIAAELWGRELNRAAMENDSLNISPPMALERLFEVLKTGML